MVQVWNSSCSISSNCKNVVKAVYYKSSRARLENDNVLSVSYTLLLLLPGSLAAQFITQSLSSSLSERVSGTSAPGDGRPLLHGDNWLPGYGEPSGGRDPCIEGGDGKTPAGVPGPPQCQAGPGYRDCHLQEAAGGRGEQVRRSLAGKLCKYSCAVRIFTFFGGLFVSDCSCLSSVAPGSPFQSRAFPTCSSEVSIWGRSLSFTDSAVFALWTHGL